MQLTSHLKLLFFLLLFAYRIKTSISQRNSSSGGNDFASSWNISGEDGPIGDGSALASDFFGCSQDQFQCLTSGKCIAKSMYCDYIIDCPDASDESKCGTCNFVNGSTCGWKDVSGIKDGGWTVKGKFLTTSPVTQFTQYKLQSPNLNGIAYFCQMVMYVKMNATYEKTQLYVSHLDGNSTEHIFKSFTFRDMRQDKDWTELITPIREISASSKANHGTYQIKIGATLYNATDQIAIRDIHFENCNPRRTIADCDFEDGDSCHWIPDIKRSMGLKWAVSRAADVDNLYAPTVDNTLGTMEGHYLWTQADPKTQNLHDEPIAVLNSIPFDFRVCLSFSYYLDSAHSIQLNVIDKLLGSQNSTGIHSFDRPTGGNWKYVQADIMFTGAQHVVSFEAIISENGTIALDDIRMQYGGCPEPIEAGRCDFENDLCGYTVVNGDSNSSWQRLQGNDLFNQTQNTFPDHTTNTLNGHMMVFYPSSFNDLSRITSEQSDFASYRCLTFYYYISDYYVGTLEVDHRPYYEYPGPDLDSDKNGHVKRFQPTNVFAPGSWRKVSLTLIPLDDSVFDFIAAGTSNTNKGFIALDDIALTNGKCREPVSCDFELDNCGWFMYEDETTSTYERTKPSDPNKKHFCPIPPVDHTLKTANGHYLDFCFHDKDSLMTTIQSDDFNATMDYCLSFWTLFSTSNNSIRIDVYVHGLKGQMQIASLKTDNNPDWTFHKIDINGEGEVEIHFITISILPFEFNPLQSVAIDDIKLTPHKCSYRPKPSDPNQPPGGKKKPNEHEILDFRCNFDLNECNYYVNSSNGASFVVTNGDDAKNFLPNTPVTDHTHHSYNGGYLELQKDKLLGKGKYAILASKQTISPDEFGDRDANVLTTHICVDFWYVMNGEAINWLNISLLSANDNLTLTPAYHLEGTFGPTWRHKAVTLTFLEESYLYFIGSSSDLQSGVLALDDISIFVGICPFEENCDFSGYTCGWDNNVSLPLSWEIVSYATLPAFQNISIPRIYDHTLGTEWGQYLYLNASFDTRGKSAQLISPILKPEKKCLQFWYYFYGLNVGQLNVYVVYNGLLNLKYLLKSEFNSDVNKWMFSQVPIERHFYDMDFQFVIEVKRGGDWSPEYQIALDDVEYLDFCQPIGSCNFEEGFCTYSNMGDLVYNRVNYSMWGRAVGKNYRRGPTVNPLPPHTDHTTKRDDGIYAYVDKGPYASLYTPYFVIDGPMCLTFSYFLNCPLNGNLPTMLVLLFHLNVENFTLTELLHETIDSKTRSTDLRQGEWLQHSINLNNVTGHKMMLQFTGIISEKDQFIGLDDISMLPGACDEPKYSQGFPCVANPKAKTDFVNFSQVCDFVMDCVSGADEQNCGYTCKFDGDCNWQVKNVTSTFLKVDLTKPLNNSFKRTYPLRDHKYEANGLGSYLRLYDLPGPFVDNPEASYETPWLQNSGPLCEFSFYYFLSDPQDRNALLRVRIIEPNNPLGIEVFRDQAGEEEGTFWKRALVLIGRIRGRFKVQINAQMKIVQGGGAIAIDDISFSVSECEIPVKANPIYFSCSADMKNKCSDPKYCFGDDRLCDYQDDCGDRSDEVPERCDTKLRGPLRCDFESGVCLWKMNTYISKDKPNGLRWGAVDDIDDYAYGVKRDHTLNSELGHVLYLWNVKKQTGRIESPLISVNSTGGALCELRFFYLYKSKDALHYTSSLDAKVMGSLNVYLKFSNNGTLFKYHTVGYLSAHSYFERYHVELSQNVNEPFFVVLEITPGSDHYGIWAIDDVSFSSGCQVADSSAVTDPTYTPFPWTTHAPSQCNDTDFYCTLDKDNPQKLCIISTQVCDFYPDCVDGSDESNCGESSFNTGWKDISNGRIYWNIDKNGEVRSKVRDGVTALAVLQSVNFGETGGACAVTFNYYIDIPTESIKLILTYSDERKRTRQIELFNSRTANNIKYAKWNIAKVFIGAHHLGWNLQFMGLKDVVNNKTDSIRIRNINFMDCVKMNFTNCQDSKDGYWPCSTGVCISDDQVCDYVDDCGDNSDEYNCNQLSSFRCSFESNRNTSDTCGLDLTNKKWQRFRAVDTRNFMGPTMDHTTDTENGHYLMLTAAVFDQVSIKSDTQFVTPVFDPENSGACHIRFYYMMNGIATLTISKRLVDSSDMSVIASYDTSPNDTFLWKRISEPLTTRMPYQIVISAKIANIQTKSFVAIDDISFTSECILHKPPKPTNSTDKCLLGNLFGCNDHSTCIPLEQVCDFYNNCPNGDDEVDCPSTCDFDHASPQNPLCAWSQNADDPNPLNVGVSSENVNTAANFTQYYPSADNTFKNSSGRFMFIYPLNYTTKVDNKDLVIYSPEYVSASPYCTFNMDFYVATDDNSTTSNYIVTLQERRMDGTFNSYLLRKIDASDVWLWDTWTTLTVGIGMRAGVFQILISRPRNVNMTDTFAIDNIRFTNCSYTAPNDQYTKNPVACKSDQFTCSTHSNCIPQSQVCDLTFDCADGSDESNCAVYGLELTFEAKDGFNSSGFTLGNPGRNGDESWKLISGPAPERKAFDTGPPFDHTFFNKSGHYLYSRPFDFGVDAWFISPMLKATNPLFQCSLRFYYYLYGLNENLFTIYIRNQTQSNYVTVSKINVTSQDMWRSAWVPLQSDSSPFQVIISAVSGGYYADFALDDIMLSSGCVIDDSNSTLPTGTPSPAVSTVTPPFTDPQGVTVDCDFGFFTCANELMCVPLISKCNFIADCGDGSDEFTPDCPQPKCVMKSAKIENDCGFTVNYPNASQNFAWQYSTSDDFSKKTGVQFANMFKNFFYLDLSAGNRDDLSNLVSKTISETSSSCKLAFKYACDANHCPLQMSIISQISDQTVQSLKWIALENDYIVKQSGYQVYEAQIYIGHRNTFQVSIGTVKQLNIKSFILVSSIEFVDCNPPKFNIDPTTNHCTESEFQCLAPGSYGSCIPKGEVCDFQYDCRHNEDEAKCDNYTGRCDMEQPVTCDAWTFESSDPRIVFITESGLHGLSYLPSIDHTNHSEGNFYMSFHTSTLVNYLGANAADVPYNTRIVSVAFSSNSSSDCKFRLWYNLIGPSGSCSLKISKRYSSNATRLLRTIQSNIFDIWERAEILISEWNPNNDQIGPHDDFQLVLEGQVGLKQPCSVNIDDLSLTPQCIPIQRQIVPDDVPNPNNIFGNLCKPNFMCHNKICYNLDQRCNFLDDCGDGTDEESCPAYCSFEDAQQMCGWYNMKGLLSTFVRAKGPSPNAKTGGTGPTKDHTTQEGNGYYLLASNFSTYNSKIELHSPYFPASGPNCRFQFAFFLNEPTHSDRINVYLKGNSHPPNITKIWTFDPMKAFHQVWNQVDPIYVGRQRGFSILIEAIQGVKDSKADLALDDFQFTNCQQQNGTEVACSIEEYRCDDGQQCIQYYQMCNGNVDCGDYSDETDHCTQTNGTCWFVDENWKTLCNWIDLKKDFTFEFDAVPLNATKDRETNTGPQSLLLDSYGYVVMKAKGHSFGQRAAIASPEFPASQGVCSVSFHYYMFGTDNMGELTMYTLAQNGTRLDYFRMSGNRGPQWNYVENIIVGNPSPYRVVFEGVVGSSPYSDIAIGYTSFSRDCAAGRWVEKANTNLTAIEVGCHSGFYCHNSHECISLDWVCDGIEDCGDGTDEVNCKIIRQTGRKKGGPGLIIGFSILTVVVVLAVIGALFGYRRYYQNRPDDRLPFLDNSFETTSHRDLDYTLNHAGSSSKSSEEIGKSKIGVSLEMTTRKSNLKNE